MAYMASFQTFIVTNTCISREEMVLWGGGKVDIVQKWPEKARDIGRTSMQMMLPYRTTSTHSDIL